MSSSPITLPNADQIAAELDLDGHLVQQTGDANLLEATQAVKQAIENLPVPPTPPSTVSVSNFPSQPTTIAVSNLPSTQPISGSVSVSNFPSPVTSVSVSNLPSGGSTLAKQDELLTAINAVKTSVENIPLAPTPPTSVSVSNFPTPVSSVSVSNLPATQAISAVSLPLPSSASTSAKQDSLISAVNLVKDAVSAIPLAPSTISISNQISGYSTSTKQDDIKASVDAVKTAVELIPEAPSNITVSNLPSIQPISASSLPLPTGAATLEEQQAITAAVIANAPLSSVDVGNFPTDLATAVKQDEIIAAIQASSGGAIGEVDDTLGYWLPAIHEKMPRVDSNDRMTVNIETGTVGVTGTLTGVTTVSTVSALTRVDSAGTNSNSLNTVVQHIAQSGAAYLYDPALMVIT